MCVTYLADFQAVSLSLSFLFLCSEYYYHYQQIKIQDAEANPPPFLTYTMCSEEKE